MPLYDLAGRRLQDSYQFVTQVSKSSFSPDKWSFADGLGNPVYWFDGTASFVLSASWADSAGFVTASNVYGPYGSSSVLSASYAVTAGFAFNSKAAGIEWDIQLNSASATTGVLGVAELGRGYYNWNAAAWTFGQRNTGSSGELIGSWSFAINSGSIASGEYSFVNGLNVIAIGTASHAEGKYTTASGDFSHAEGYLTSTSPAAEIAHAEGYFTFASGTFSHTEGEGTATFGPGSHAEGFYTSASGNYAHAEGIFTKALGIYSHAEGSASIAYGTASHASGLGTIASGSYQTVIGRYNLHGNTTDLFVIGSGSDDLGRGDTFAVSNTRMFASKSIYFPDLVTASYTNIVIIDSSSGQLFYASSSDLVPTIAISASHSITTKAAGIEWDIQLNSASATDGRLGVAELGRGYYNWNAGAWTFGNRITGSSASLVGSWSFHTNKDNYVIGDYSIAHGYKNIAGDSADSVEGYFTSTVNDTVTSLNLNFVYDSIANTITVLQPGDFTIELDALDLTNANLKSWYYSGTDDLLYEIDITGPSAYNVGTDRTYFSISSIIAGDDNTGNGILYYQSFSSVIKNEPLANHAEGDHTIASGDASHAEGKYTWANAVGSHAEGLNTISSNSGSHAEGRNTIASGDGAHAEGSNTVASGSSTHAEGYGTIALGDNSHAGGFYTIASGENSFAGGRETVAYECGSFAIGIGTIASGAYQTVVGRYNSQSNINDYFIVGDGTSDVSRSNALGVNDVRFYASNSIYFPDLISASYSNIVIIDSSSGQLFYTTASNLVPSIAVSASHSITTRAAGIEWDIQLNSASAANGRLGVAELGRGYYNWNAAAWTFGNRNTGSNGELVGSWSFAVNSGSVASGPYSFVNGLEVMASGTGSHAEGLQTTASGDYSHAEGSASIAYGLGSHAEGLQTTASGDYSHAEGIFTKALGIYSHAEGSGSVAYGIGSHAEGFNSYAGGTGSHATGKSTYITDSSDYSTAEGGYTYVNADYSHAEGYFTSASLVNKGTPGGMHAEGRFTKALGIASHAEGERTIASGSYSHAEGSGSIALGIGSHAGGLGTIASGSYQTVIGRYNLHGNTDDYFVIGSGSGDSDRGDVFAVSNTRFYASKSIYFPDLTDTFKPNLLVFDSESKQIFYHTGSAFGGGGIGSVGPGRQNYISFFSGSTTQISSSTILLSFETNTNPSEPSLYTIERSVGFEKSSSYGSTISVDNDISLNSEIVIIADINDTSSYSVEVIKEIPWDFATAWVDFYITPVDNGGTYPAPDNMFCTMFGTIMINRLGEITNPETPPIGYYNDGVGNYLRFLTTNRVNATNYYVDSVLGAGIQYKSTIYKDVLGVNSSLNNGDGTTKLDYAWMARDYKYGGQGGGFMNPGGAGFSFQAIESISYLPDIFTPDINYIRQYDYTGANPYDFSPTNVLQGNLYRDATSGKIWGVYFAYDIIETGIGTNKYKLRIWCINSVSNNNGPGSGGSLGNTIPANIQVKTKTKLIYEMI